MYDIIATEGIVVIAKGYPHERIERSVGALTTRAQRSPLLSLPHYDP